MRMRLDELNAGGRCGPSRNARKACVLSALLFLAICQSAPPTLAEDSRPLVQPPICSAIAASRGTSAGEVCRTEPSAGRPQNHDISLSLTAATGPVEVGGYRVETENYNGAYLTPVIEAKPGDTLKLRLVNKLMPRDGAHGGADGGHGHGSGASNSTNLHTHGLIVSANNRRDVEPEQPGDGDNIFVTVERNGSFDYRIEIPTELPATLLDGDSGIIEHPTGLYWYHSHLHGISGPQVAGGMSGLLSIGAADANLLARAPSETKALRSITDVAYLMLRDLQVETETDPAAATGISPARWITDFRSRLCGDDPILAPIDRKGYCRPPPGSPGADENQLWLFTVNGQRYPTITIGSGRNHLWRIANTSASVTYDLEIVPDKGGGRPLPFEVLSVDGVVPGAPVLGSVAGAGGHVAAEPPTVTRLRLMPASRADVYLINHGRALPGEYRLRTAVDGDPRPDDDQLPEIQLARVVLEASAPSGTEVALNTPIAAPAAPLAAPLALDSRAAGLPEGCVRDVYATEFEHRRITFITLAEGRLGLISEIRRPNDLSDPKNTQFTTQGGTRIRADFNQYLNLDGSVNWDGTGDGSDPNQPPKHVCIRLATGKSQLWLLHNPSDELHNFHLHQTKFRYAKPSDLLKFKIDPALSDNPSSEMIDKHIWHDTLPVPTGKRIFIIVNFVAEEQLGRYVFHCHILKHEDLGMMAPIEVLP
jgi:FtsP/CotA-like multicopper oxidase with cupredoxin domain